MATANDTVGKMARLAAEVAGELLKAVPTLKGARPIDRGVIIMQALLRGEDSAATLKAVIRDESSLGDLRNGWMEIRGDFGMSLQEHVIPILLINSAIDGCLVESVIADAQAFAASRTCVTERYTPLAGVTVSEAVNLGGDVELIPWTDVPDGDRKMKFGMEAPHPVRLDSIPPFFQTRAIATSALRTRSAECQVLFASNKDAKEVTGSLADDSAIRSTQTQDIVRCITAVSVKTVASLGGWGKFDEKIANKLVGSGYSYNQALFDNVVYRASREPVALNGNSLSELFCCFEALKPSEKDVMRVALDRLGQALRRSSVVDKAIDLGIALEVMLLHSIGENDRGELRYRSAIRGATFLGGDKSKRLKTFKLLKEAYDMRSRAVHSGILKAKKNGRPPKEILEEAIEVCADVARLLIRRGSFPDWETEYVIGEDP